LLFNSLEFIIFFPIITALFFILPHRLRWSLLLAASCVFYMAFIPKYILILAVTILVDYFIGLKLAKLDGSKKKAFLILSIVCNVGFLFVFKYFNFFNTNFTMLADFLHWNYPVNNLSIILPIGLSFHTFQSMSYIIEVYRGNHTPEKHFGIYALYVMFYPQLVAGPIERPQNLLNSFHEVKHFDYNRAMEGIRLMIWGMFKKVVIADNLALIVDSVYNNPYQSKGLPIILATYFFAFQIYCDFSGYTDIARGAAKVMGFNLMLNFDRPYFSKSISEFWRRWHISLSSWFRDYVYIPLGGSKKGKWRWYRNLMIVFLLSGFWHGANWTYIIWGGLNGFYLVASIWTKGIRKKFYEKFPVFAIPPIKKTIQIFVTFNLISFAWIFFRANSFTAAKVLIVNIFTGIRSFHFVTSTNWFNFDLLLGIILTCFLLLIQFIQRKNALNERIAKSPLAVQWLIYTLGISCILLLGVTKASPFIYFQF
jgi:alginate O-acetyltransferase complex protein AlgI